MARRRENLQEELAALDREVSREPAVARRGLHKSVPIVISCVLLLSFGTVTWYAYNQGILEGSEEAAPFLKPSGPLKIAPSNPGGAEVPNRDKFVYNRLERREDDQKVERLLPPPEQPKEPPKAEKKPETVPDATTRSTSAPDTPKTEAAAAAGVEAGTEDTEKTDMRPRGRTANEALRQALDLIDKDAPPALPAPGTDAKVATSGDKPAEETKTAQAAGSGPIRLTPPRKTTEVETTRPAPPPPPPIEAPKPVVTKPKPPAPPKPPTVQQPPKSIPASRVTSGGKGYYIQLGALRSYSAAERAWSAARKKNAGLLRGRSLAVERAEVPKKGTYFRVQSGPMESRAAAKVLCDELKKRGQGCFVVRRK